MHGHTQEEAASSRRFLPVWLSTYRGLALGTFACRLQVEGYIRYFLPPTFDQPYLYLTLSPLDILRSSHPSNHRPLQSLHVEPHHRRQPLSHSAAMDRIKEVSSAATFPVAPPAAPSTASGGVTAPLMSRCRADDNAVSAANRK